MARPLAEIEKGIERCQRALAFVAADVRPVYERRLAELEIERDQALDAMDRADRRSADRIDGYDRDDLGESPDY